jgi:predicted membrane-bound spermidine synthase
VSVLASVLAALVVARVFIVARMKTRVLARRAVQAGEFVVRDAGPWRELVFIADRAMVHTRVARGNDLASGFAYTDAFHLGPVLAGGCQRALFLGGGGAIAPRQFVAFYDGAHVDVVDLHPEAFELARAYFGLEAADGMALHTADARAFVESAPDGRYDVIVLDAYGAFDLPRHLATRQFYEATRERLRAHGALCVNVVGRLDGDPHEPLQAVSRTLRRVFGTDSVLALPIALAGEDPRALDPVALRNVVLCALRGSPPTSSAFDDALRALPRAKLAGVEPAIERARRALCERELGPLEDEATSSARG